MKPHTLKHLLIIGGVSWLALASSAYATLKEALEAINDQDYSFAAQELNRLIEKEQNKDALYHLGQMYENGLGYEKDLQKALTLYKQAAEKGNEKAALRIGNAYYTGGELEKDYQNAFKWYMVAAEQNNYLAQYNIGLMYEEGTSVKKDAVKAFEFYKKSADQGYAPAQIALGHMFLNGIGTPQDYTQAIFWYKLGADQGDFNAQMKLAKLYANTSVRGLPFNIVGAHMYFNLIAAYGSSPLKEEAARLRDELTEKMTNENVTLAQNRANKWKKKTREASLPSRRVNDGILDEESDDFVPDKKEKGSEEKEEQIQITVQTDLQELLVAAGISRRDLNKAVRADDFSEIEAALKQKTDDPLAQLGLADLYVLGQGLDENPKEAINIYKKLAGKNNPIAFYRLAPLYCEGNGTEPDLAECYKLMLLAKKYADEASLPAVSEAMQMLDENLDKEIRDAGKKLADEWGQKKEIQPKKKKILGLFSGDKKDEPKAEKAEDKKEESKKETSAADDDDLFSGL
ncbi:MAG: sel1 repeat family protein [Alphaproteobacteria bacterium]|nr:sel1 repeat family protein [Alphaproteobacteria bacterium]